MFTKKRGPYWRHADSRLKFKLIEEDDVAKPKVVQEQLPPEYVLQTPLLLPKKRPSQLSQKSTDSSLKRQKTK
jgi:hypothetical protein